MPLLDMIKFDKNGLVPAIAQDVESGAVLMMAYMNREALEKTLKTGFAHYYSRSRNKLWRKGESSGHAQKVRELLVDCDADTILMKVEQKVAACHTGHFSCFYRKAEGNDIIEIPDKRFDEEKVYGK